MNSVNQFITDRYDDIVLMSSRICKGSVESEEVAHYVISEFLQSQKADGLVSRGEAMSYLSGAIWRSFHSSTSPYHTIYRQKGRVFGLSPQHSNLVDTDQYDYEQDSVVEEIYGILTDMEIENVEQWYAATIFKMYIQTSNYSEIARATGIPRTSISAAVDVARKHIKQQLKIRGIEWEH